MMTQHYTQEDLDRPTASGRGHRRRSFRRAHHHPLITNGAIFQRLLDARKARPGVLWNGTPEWIRTTDLLLRRESSMCMFFILQLPSAAMSAHRGVFSACCVLCCVPAPNPNKSSSSVRRPTEVNPSFCSPPLMIVRPFLQKGIGLGIRSAIRPASFCEMPVAKFREYLPRLPGGKFSGPPHG